LEEVGLGVTLNPPGSWADLIHGRQVVIISPQSWGDLWVSKHWIASELSKCNDVLFVEPPIWLGGVARHLLRSRRIAMRAMKPLRTVGPRLSVYSPVLLPHRLGSWSGQLARQASGLVTKLSLRRPLVLNFDVRPELAFGFDHALAVYYCVDPAYSSPEVRMGEMEVCRRSDLLLAVSENYRKHLEALAPGKPIHVIPHGYAFETAREIDTITVEMPAELQRLPRPILGFVGSIHDAYVDIARVEALSKRHPGASIVLIGPYRDSPIGMDLSRDALRRLKALGNVHLLGPRPFSVVPRYVKFFDVCLVLLNIDSFDPEANIKGRTLFKWLMYLAMGKPVVAPKIDEAAAIRHLVYLAANNGEYLDCVDAALAEDSARRMDRIEYASAYSFESILGRIASAIVEAESSRQVPGALT
jgi:glycosyltransferase involved in cell wall biosynthesis